MYEREVLCMCSLNFYPSFVFTKHREEKNHISQNKKIPKGRKEMYFCTYLLQDGKSLLGYASHNMREYSLRSGDR